VTLGDRSRLGFARLHAARALLFGLGMKNNQSAEFITIDSSLLGAVSGGTTPGSRDFDVNKDGAGRTIDHDNGTTSGWGTYDPNSTVDHIPIKPVTLN
jgi:hypothetical protein